MLLRCHLSKAAKSARAGRRTLKPSWCPTIRNQINSCLFMTRHVQSAPIISPFLGDRVILCRSSGSVSALFFPLHVFSVMICIELSKFVCFLFEYYLLSSPCSFHPSMMSNLVKGRTTLKPLLVLESISADRCQRRPKGRRTSTRLVRA